MSCVRLERVSFAHRDAVPILEQVELHLAEGWTGLVGENGCGKTTLLRLIAGELALDSGRIRLEPDGARVVHCPQGIDVAGSEVEALGARDDGEGRRLRGLLALDVEGLARWTTLSPGERKRWQVGAALAREPDVLLLDEPTNHVDAEARALLLGALRRFRGVGVLVSHDRAHSAASSVVLPDPFGPSSRTRSPWPSWSLTSRSKTESPARISEASSASSTGRGARAKPRNTERPSSTAIGTSGTASLARSAVDLSRLTLLPSRSSAQPRDVFAPMERESRSLGSRRRPLIERWAASRSRRASASFRAARRSSS